MVPRGLSTVLRSSRGVNFTRSVKEGVPPSPLCPRRGGNSMRFVEKGC